MGRSEIVLGEEGESLDGEAGCRNGTWMLMGEGNERGAGRIGRERHGGEQ